MPSTLIKKVKRFNNIIHGDNISSHDNETSGKDGVSSCSDPFLVYQMQARKFGLNERQRHIYASDEEVIGDVTPNVPDE